MFDYPELKTIGKLKVASRLADPSAPSAVIIHGYGANAYDLWSLQTELQVGKPLNWYFPDGCLGLDMGPGYSGRAWFPINEKELERAMMTGQPLNYSQWRPPGLDRARDLIMQMIAAQNIPLEQLVLGGFSQGAMLALEVALSLPQPPKALMLFSSTLMNEKETKIKARELNEKSLAQNSQPIEFFQSHGHEDTILPFSGAEKLRDCLEEAGWKSNWQEFGGGHELPRNMLKSASYYLKAKLK